MLKYEVFIDIYPTMKGLKYLRYGEFHRKDSPALIIDKGSFMWFEYDKEHRINGPALVNSNGTTGYSKKGITCIEEDYYMLFE